VPARTLIPWFELGPWALGPIQLPPFGLLVASGVLLGTYVADWYGERTGVPRALVGRFLVYTVVTGFLASMLLNGLVYDPAGFTAMLEAGELRYPGMSAFGGFLGGVGGALWFRHSERASVFVLGDVFCFAFPFAWLLCRTGCFVVHDHPGVVTDFFLAVDDYGGGELPRHDLGLYEVFWSAGTIVLLLWLGRQRRPRGFFLALVPGLYAPTRFLLDFLRETPAAGGDVRYAGLTPGQYGAMLMLLAAVAVAVRVARGPEIGLWIDGAPPGAEVPTPT